MSMRVADRERERPRINAKEQDLHVLTQEALQLLGETNHPAQLFRYGNTVARIERDDCNMPVAEVLDADKMRNELAARLSWFHRDRDGNESSARPAWDVAKNILASPPKELPFPPLNRITGRSVFTPKGGRVRRGYDSDTGILYVPPRGFTLRRVPERPSKKQLGDARRLIVTELLGDFPFTGDSSLAHVVSALLLPSVRAMIDGPTPMYSIEKPTPGTGATLLAQSLCRVACGREPAALTMPTNEAECARTILAKLMEAPEFVLLDNITSTLQSAALASAITASRISGRVIGTSTAVRVPVQCVWMATANNPSLSTEMSRRSVPIRMDARSEHPHLRKDFRHPRLTRWVAEHEGELVWAALILVQAWIAEGRPLGSKTFGMFESWAETTGGILDVAGIDGFLDNLHDSPTAPDAEAVAWGLLTQSWWSEHKGEAVTVANLYPLADQLDLGEGLERSRRTRLGKALSKMRDRVFDGHVIRAAGTYQGAQRWRLEQVQTDE